MYFFIGEWQFIEIPPLFPGFLCNYYQHFFKNFDIGLIDNTWSCLETITI